MKLTSLPRQSIWLLERQANILILNKCDLFLDFIHMKRIFKSVKGQVETRSLFFEIEKYKLYSDWSCFFHVPL